jgi:hypothetical protein
MTVGRCSTLCTSNSCDVSSRISQRTGGGERKHNRNRSGSRRSPNFQRRRDGREPPIRRPSLSSELVTHYANTSLPTSSPCAGTKRRGPRLWISTWLRREHEAMMAQGAERKLARLLGVGRGEPSQNSKKLLPPGSAVATSQPAG